MKIAIIGGGIAGLSTAYYLQKNIKADIDIFEKDATVGGLASTIKIGKTSIEKYYHHVFTHDTCFLELVDELGLTNDLMWIKSSVGFFSEGVIYPFTTPMDLLKFKPLNFFDRIRFGMSSLFIANHKDYDELEKITAEDFLMKMVGKSGFEKIWKPMLKIKFGDNYNKIPAVWIWGRIVQRFKSRSKGANNEVLGYMKGSFNTFNEKLLTTVQNNGARIHLNSDVSEILINNNKCIGIKVNNSEQKYDYVVCTTALPEFVKLCKNAPEDYINPLKTVAYDCTLGVLWMLTKKLNDIYWINISDNEIPFGGLIEHTNFVPSENYEGKTLLYFSKYLGVDNPLFKMKDTEIIDIYVKYLKKIYPNFDESTIEKHYIFRDRYAQPIWSMNYTKIKPDYKTPINGLYMANTAQIYPNDRGMNFSVELGKEVTKNLVKNI